VENAIPENFVCAKPSGTQALLVPAAIFGKE
jgi:hypothetical protein